jgi:hypothetical protein
MNAGGEKGFIVIRISFSLKYKSQVFAYHITIVGDTLKNHLNSTLIRNCSSY